MSLPLSSLSCCRLCFTDTLRAVLFQTLHVHYLLRLLHEARRVLRTLPNINRISSSLSGQVTVCGDLHGKLDDLYMILQKVSTLTKDGGLIRQLSLHFTRAQFFASHSHFQRVHSFCPWPAAHCIVYYRTGGETGDNSIGYDLYCQTARWTVRKKWQLADLTVLI